MHTQGLTLAKALISAAQRPVKAASRRMHIWFFRWRTRKAPFDEAKAKEIVYPLLAGDIMRAISYQNIDSQHLFIAVVRRSSERDHDACVHVLEQIGQTFTIVWKSRPQWGFNPSLFEVRDIDGDGHREVIFEELSHGTGAGSRSLMVYSSSKQQLFTLTEFLNWQNLAGPISPEISIEPANDKEMTSILERVAKGRGFLRPGIAVDFDDPEFAVQRWHKENGKATSGQIRIHYYQGYPRCRASVPATLDSGTILWIAFFKGPLVGYEKLKERHFIAYSPAWFYNWAKCLAFDGENLWFGVHMKNGLMCFRPHDNSLRLHESFQGTALPEVDELEFDQDEGVLVLNRTLRIPLDAFRGRSTPDPGLPIN